MKYCTKCGSEIMDEAVVCPNCGCSTGYPLANNNSGLKTAAKVFMIISCVALGIYIIPLCWTIPMTVSYCNKIKYHQPISTGFKVCTLIFVNLVAGILMLCDDEV